MGERRLWNVLVATDLTVGGARAVARAARLPLAAGAAITVLHVLPDGPEARADAGARRALDETARLAAEIRAGAGEEPVAIRPVLARGRAFVEIIRRARAERAELVVIGRHGRRAVRDLFVGSTAERVVRKGDLPVLLVNRTATGPYRRPLVAADLSETSRRGLALALRLIDPGVRSIEVIHAIEDPYRGPDPGALTTKQVLRARMEQRASARAAIGPFLATMGTPGVRFRVRLRYGDPRRVIPNRAGRIQADLVALGTHGRSGLAHLLIGSVAEAVIRGAPCDVLVARPADFSFELP